MQLFTIALAAIFFSTASVASLPVTLVDNESDLLFERELLQLFQRQGVTPSRHVIPLSILFLSRSLKHLSEQVGNSPPPLPGKANQGYFVPGKSTLLEDRVPPRPLQPPRRTIAQRFLGFCGMMCGKQTSST